MLSLLSCPPVAFQAGGAVLRTPSSAAASMQVGTAEPLSRGTNALEDYQLRAIYQRADADGSGEVDREELTSALFAVGYRLDVDEYAAMFDEADVDGGGTITFEEFKDFIVKKPPPPITKSQQFAMELFYKYAAQGWGYSARARLGLASDSRLGLALRLGAEASASARLSHPKLQP